MGQLGSMVHEERRAIGMQVVGYPASSTDQHGGRRIGRDMNENALLRLIVHHRARTRLGNPRYPKSPRFIVSGLPKIHFMSRLAKRQLTERAEVGTLEKSGKRLLHHFRLVNRPTL